MCIDYLKISCTLLLAIFISLPAGADQVKEEDGYQIYYSVFNTSFLTPEIAEAYHIVRAKNRAIVNIAIRKKNAAGNDETVKAIVNGTVKDLVYRRPLKFFTVSEDNSVYYLSELRFNHKEKIVFDINVQPDSSKKSYTVTFDKTLYVDE